MKRHAYFDAVEKVMSVKLINRFLADKRGSFPIMAVIAFPVIFGGVALSVDLMNNLRMRTELQNASDTAVLYTTRFYQEKKALPTTLQVEKFIKANFNGPVQNVKISFDTVKSEMKLTSESAQTPYMMNYFGNHNSVLKAEARATLGVSGILEFALALDTTKSMNEEGRIGGLKTAANSFVNMMMDVKDRGADVRGGIVPFERYVNVGVGYRTAPWMQVPTEYDNRTYKQSCSKPQISCNKTEQVCTPAQTINHPAQGGSCWYEDGIKKCWAGSAAWVENVAAKCKNKCTEPVYGAEVCTTKQTGGDNWTWKGCVLSRMNGWNVKEQFGGNKFTGILDGESWKSCATPLQALTGTRSVLLGSISALTPSGDTYLPEGVMWGTRVLTMSEPFTESNDIVSGLETRKALILMTDGMNSLRSNQWGWHDALSNMEDSSEPDGVTLAACNEAKAKNIEVYTVSFGSAVPNKVKTMLDSCASKPEFNFHASNNADLLAAFRGIGDKLLSVRLSQ
jgi:Flp pilus assembly protein TadG